MSSERPPVEYTNGASASELPIYRPNVEHAEFDGPNLLQVIWHGRWIVLICTVVALVAGVWYLATATPIFEATSRIYVEKETPTAFSGDIGIGMTQSRNYLYTQAELFRSRPILEDAVKRLPVSEMREFRDVMNPVAHLRIDCLNVDVGKRDEILSVSARSPYPNDAALIVNEVVDAYHAYHLEKKQTTARELLKILEEKKTESDAQIEKDEQKRTDLKIASGELLLESRGENLALANLAGLHRAHLDAELALAVAESEHQQLAAVAKSAVSGRAAFLPPDANAYIEAMRREYRRVAREHRFDLEDAEGRLAILKEQYTGDSLSVRAARARVERLRTESERLEKEHREQVASFVDETFETALQRARVARDEAKANLAELGVKLAANREQAIGATSKNAELEQIESRLERAQKYSDLLTEKIQALNVSEKTGALAIIRLDAAEIPEKPVAPRPTRIMAAALLIGLLLGAGLALLKDQLDHRLRSSEEMASVIGAPVLGVLPHMKDVKNASLAGRRVHLSPESLSAEAYRTVRTAIDFNAPNAKTILFTSPTGNDGKTTVACNVAIAMAQVGRRVLLIDLDMRRPSQHKVWPVEEKGDRVSITDVIAGRAIVDDLMYDTEITELKLMPCLRPVDNPAELINRPEFAELLQVLSARFDRIIVDSPPVMPVADSRILGRLCDATIVVLRAEKSARKVTELTREALVGVGVDILGTIVNDVPRTKGGQGYYGYYSNYGAYGSYGSYGRYDREGAEGAPERSRSSRRRRASRTQAD